MGRWLSAKRAHHIAVVLQSVCYLMTFLALLTIVLVLLGRVEVNLTTPAGHYQNALLLEKDHEATTRFLIASLSNQQVYLNMIGTDGSVDIATWLGIALIGTLRVLPIGLCFFWMSRFFGNLSQGRVFIASNADILLYSGGLLVAGGLLVPFLNGLVLPWVINQFSANVLSISANLDMSSLFIGAGLLVMAYVFHYGIYLQDEADHTL